MYCTSGGWRSERTSACKPAEGLLVHCPQCGTLFIRPARPRGVLEYVLGFLTVYPFRCQLCTHRSLAFQGVPRFSPRRDFKRFHVRYPTSFRATLGGRGEGEKKGTMINLSMQGCSIQSEDPVEEGTTLRLEFVARDQEAPVAIQAAEVVSAKRNCLGLKFLEMRAEDEERIRHIIESHLQGQPD